MARKPWHHKEILEGMYNEQKLSIREIAEIFHTTASNILYWMRKLDITTRKFDIGEINKGKSMPEDKKQMLSECAKERFKDKGNHPMTGKKHTVESKRKMSETKKRRNQLKRLGIYQE